MRNHTVFQPLLTTDIRLLTPPKKKWFRLKLALCRGGLSIGGVSDFSKKNFACGALHVSFYLYWYMQDLLPHANSH